MNGKHLFIIPTRIASIPVERVLLSRLTTSHTSETDEHAANWAWGYKHRRLGWLLSEKYRIIAVVHQSTLGTAILQYAKVPISYGYTVYSLLILHAILFGATSTFYCLLGSSGTAEERRDRTIDVIAVVHQSTLGTAMLQHIRFQSRTDTLYYTLLSLHGILRNPKPQFYLTLKIAWRGRTKTIVTHVVRALFYGSEARSIKGRAELGWAGSVAVGAVL
ncbi:hypothetical protein J6590_056507 [Homalodisca vitripennis]|nr:hypothetical protein J6590_056507 [Homalodisca vitripennis]